MENMQEQACARIICPDCEDWLVPAVAGHPDLPEEEREDLLCINCETRYPWRGGMLSLGGSTATTPIARRFPAGEGEVTFLELLEETIRVAVNSDRTFEDEVYALLSWMDVFPGQTVLQLGCDDGRLIPPLANAVYPGIFVAIEPDTELLVKARKHCMEQGVENVLLLHGDLMRPPVRTASFDRLVLCGVLHGTDSPAQYTEYVSRALVMDGIIGGAVLARSNIESISKQQEAFGRSTGVYFTEINQYGQDLCRGGFNSFQMDQASNWVARFVARLESPWGNSAEATSSHWVRPTFSD